LVLGGGLGIRNNGSIYTDGDIYANGLATTSGVVINGTEDADSTSSGALQVLGGVAIQKSLYCGGGVRIEQNEQSTSVGSGSLVTNGGVGIGGSLYVETDIYSSTLRANLNVSGSILTARSTEDAIDTSSGVLLVQGGTSIQKSLYCGGVVRIEQNEQTTSVGSGSLVINGGLGIGAGGTGSLYVANDIYSSTLRANLNVSGNILTARSTDDAIDTSSGTLRVQGGASIQKALYCGGNVAIQSTTASASATTGALTIAGGVGFKGTLSAEGNIAFRGTSSSHAITFNSGQGGGAISFCKNISYAPLSISGPNTFSQVVIGYKLGGSAARIGILNFPSHSAAASASAVYTSSTSITDVPLYTQYQNITVLNNNNYVPGIAMFSTSGVISIGVASTTSTILNDFTNAGNCGWLGFNMIF
jgi:hypothetical protein